MIKYIEEINKVVVYNNNEIIGYCEYEQLNNIWNIIHTKVNSNYQGQGIAKNLVEKVVEKANKNNITITADCSYAKKILNNKK